MNVKKISFKKPAPLTRKDVRLFLFAMGSALCGFSAASAVKNVAGNDVWPQTVTCASETLDEARDCIAFIESRAAAGASQAALNVNVAAAGMAMGGCILLVGFNMAGGASSRTRKPAALARPQTDTPKKRRPF